MPLTGEAKRAYQREWLQRRREEWIESQGGQCANCGSTDRLEVDHIDRATKLCNPGQIWSRNASFREAELAKCQVLCYACHQAKTVEEFTVTHPHGTYARYNSRLGYRCDPCKASVAPYWRAKRVK